MGAERGPDGALVWPLIISKPLRNRCKTKRGPNGGRQGVDRGPNGVPDGPNGPDGVPDGGQTEGLSTFKRKNDMFCIRVM
jgi:hypothetical protein